MNTDKKKGILSSSAKICENLRIKKKEGYVHGKHGKTRKAGDRGAKKRDPAFDMDQRVG